MILSFKIQQTLATTLVTEITLPDGSKVAGTAPSFTINCNAADGTPTPIVFVTEVDKNAFDTMFPTNTEFFVEMPDAPATPAS